MNLDQTKSAILKALESGQLSIQPIMKAADPARESMVFRALAELRKDGLVLKHGDKKGTKYGLKEEEAAS